MNRQRADSIVANVNAAVPDALRSHSLFRGELTLVVERGRVLDVLRHVRDCGELAFNFPVDIAGVDYLNYPQPPFEERFAVTYHLLSWKSRERLRIQAPVPEDAPVLPSATALWSLANWTERELYDMFGIRFQGHPDLRRILMWEGFESHPLRKDYPLKGLGERSNFDRVADDFPLAAESRRLTPSDVDRQLQDEVNRELSRQDNND